eukprot:g168.t1
MASDDEDLTLDDFEDASSDEDNKDNGKKEWKSVSKDDLVQLLTEYYKKTGQSQMTPELIVKAATAYVPHQALLHHRLLEKYACPLFSITPPLPASMREPVGFFRKGKKYTGRVKPFVMPCNNFVHKSVDDATNSEDENVVSTVVYRNFKLRGKKYLEDSVKYPSKAPAFAFAGTGAFITKEPMKHVAKNLPPLKKWIEEHVDACESIFIQTWMLPGPPYFQVVNVFYRTLKRGEDKEFDLNFDRFCDGEPSLRNSKLKFKVLFASSPILVTGAISALGGDRPCIIGNKLDTHYFRGPNYLEADIDIASSIIAKQVAGVAIRNGGSSLVVDLGFIIEGHSEAELPERLLCACRYSHIDVDSVCVDYTDLSAPRAFKKTGKSGAVGL